MSAPLISVIVLTYNQEHTVGQTIDSILAQKTTFPFEIIIGEDASPSDNTRAVCEKYVFQYPNIIRLMPKVDNKGVLQNYVDSLRECRGKYIACCAGDDWWCDENKLQMQVEFLEANPDYVLVHTEISKFDVASGIEIVSPIRTKVPEGDVRKELFADNIVKAPTACYRHDAVTDELLNDLYEQNFLLEDLPMWLILSRDGGKFHFIPNQTVMYRISGESICNNRNIDKQLAFIDSKYDVLRYYRQKFNINISASLIENRYLIETIGILLASRQKAYFKTAIKRFGVFHVLCVVIRKILMKISR